MCKHRYLPLYLDALDDDKVERLRYAKGEAGWGLYTALLIRLASNDEDDYRLTTDFKFLRYSMKSKAPLSLFAYLVNESGLFATEDEGRYFYSPRLRAAMTELSLKMERRDDRASKELDDASASEAYEDAPKARSRAGWTPEKRAAQAAHGRTGGALSKRTKGIASEDKGIDKGITSEDKGIDKGIASEDKGIDKGIASEDKGIDKGIASEDKGIDKGIASEDKGIGGTIGGLNAPRKGKKKAKRLSPPTPPGGAEREERISERLLRDKEELNIALLGISDETERKRVADLLTPPTVDGKIWAQVLGAVATERLHQLEAYKPMISYSAKLSREAYDMWRCLTADAKKQLGLELAEGEIPNASDRVLLATTALSLWRSMLDKAAGAKDFLRTNSSMLNLSWLILHENYAKVASGVYDPAPASTTPTPPPPSPNSGRQPLKPYRDADYWSEEHRRGKTFEELDEREQDLLRFLNPGKYPPKDTPTDSTTASEQSNNAHTTA